VATPSVGAVACFDIRGRPPEIQEALDVEEVEGLDGAELDTLGSRGGAFTVMARLIDTHANVMTWIGQLAALAGGDAVIITLADGSTYNKCYIGRRDGGGIVVQRKIAIEESGLAKYLCEVAVSGYRSST
jgi:hypothetical protein